MIETLQMLGGVALVISFAIVVSVYAGYLIEKYG